MFFHLHSPIPHQPCLPSQATTFSPELLSCSDADPPDVTAELRHKEKPLIRVLQENNRLEAIFEDGGVPGVSFFLGENQDERAERTQRGSCQLLTPVQVHSTGLEVSSGREDDILTSDAEERTRQETQEPSDQRDSCQEAKPQEVLDFKDGAAGSQENLLEDSGSEKHNLVNHVTCDVSVSEDDVEVSCSEGQRQPNDEESNLKPAEQEVDSDGSGDESDGDGQSIRSSNGSIVKVSDEESTCDNAEEAMKDENGYLGSPKEVPLWSLADSNTGNILDLHLNGGPEEKGGVSAHGDVLQAQEQLYLSELHDLSESMDTNSTLNGGDLTDNSDFSVIDTSCSPGLAE